MPEPTVTLDPQRASGYLPDVGEGPVAGGGIVDVPEGPDEEELVAGGRLRRCIPTARQLAAGADASEFSRAPTPPPTVGAEARRAPAWQRVMAATRDLDPRSIPGAKLPLLVLMASAAVGGWGDRALAIAQPEIQASFGLSISGLITLGAFFSTTTIVLGLPLGYLVDRVKRVWLVRISVLGDAVGNLLFAGAGTVGQMIGANAFATATRDAGAPAGYPLLTDYFPSRSRARVFSLLRVAASVGVLVGGPIAGLLIDNVGWRGATFALGLFAGAVSLLMFLLKEPVRGGVDRLEMGADPVRAAVAQPPPSFSEALRGAWSIRTVRWLTFGGLVTGVASGPVGIVIQLMLANRFLLSPLQRAFIGDIETIIGIPAILVGAVLADRLIVKRPRTLMLMLGGLNFLSVGALLVTAFAPNLVVFMAPGILLGILGTMVGPAAAVVMSLVIPARYRGLGLQVNTPFLLIATWIGPVVAGYVTTNSPQQVLLIFVPFMLLGAFINLMTVSSVGRDIRAARAASMAQEESERAVSEGNNKILICRDLDVAYDDVQVLFNVDLDVREREVLALVGTNGAGKSTLLRALCGLQQPANGAIFYDNRDITSAPTHENARRGLVYMPGGQGVFPALTVRENLETAAWMSRRDDSVVDDGITRVLEVFPELSDRLHIHAGTLSGGEQQMLALGQAFLMKPKLLMIDELSLGLAPGIIERLLSIIRKMRTEGATIILVEQSLNVALTIADRAVFMERGQVAFDGPTEELLARPDLVRAVFMGGAGSGARTATRARHRSAFDAPDTRLRADNISVSFGGVRALDTVSLQLHAGEVVGIIGPNGAGKTTLFDVLSGYLSPDQGAVYLGEDDISALSPDARARLGLGRAFQSARLFPPLTVRENIAVALDRRAAKNPLLAALWAPPVRRRERKLQARVDGFIELLGLTRYADKFVRELSTGTRRAVEVACQMAAEPQVLLLDEPSSGLAQAETEALGPALTRIVRETGCGMLVIEHDLPLISSIADRLVAMELGSVVRVGPPTEVMADPTVLASYLNASSEVIERSGSRVGSVLQTIAGDGPSAGERSRERTGGSDVATDRHDGTDEEI